MAAMDHLAALAALAATPEAASPDGPALVLVPDMHGSMATALQAAAAAHAGVLAQAHRRPAVLLRLAMEVMAAEVREAARRTAPAPDGATTDSGSEVRQAMVHAAGAQRRVALRSVVAAGLAQTRGQWDGLVAQTKGVVRALAAVNGWEGAEALVEELEAALVAAGPLLDAGMAAQESVVRTAEQLVPCWRRESASGCIIS